MSAFNPSSTIWLCKVGIDSTYKNQIYFADKEKQRDYFERRVVKSFSDYLTVRTTRPDGSLQSSVKVGANIETLRSLSCNYMFYRNANHGTRIFYAFITKLIYVNEGTTEIVFETDVFQTWFFDDGVQLLPSYVVREHSKTDAIGDNLVPESFTFQDYVYQLAHTDTTLDKWGYLVGLTESHRTQDKSWFEEIFGWENEAIFAGQDMSGVFQGLFFYYFPSNKSVRMNMRIDDIMQRVGDCLVFVAAIPEFNVSGTTIGTTTNNNEGWVYASDQPAKKTIVIRGLTTNGSFEGYGPRNNKLFTSPYYRLIVTNHNGQEAEYSIEDFNNPNEVKFEMYGDISANPSVTLFPLMYKGLTSNYDAGITISGFPQCSTNTDTYKLWLSKNQYNLAGETALNVGQIIAGIAGLAAAGATGGTSLIAGAGIISGAKGVSSTINSLYQSSKEPNRSSGGGAKNNLLTAIGKNKFEYYKQTIRREHAQTIDDYFTMYGYQTNKVKVPNVSSRPAFNYVQTVDVNIVGGIPSDDMERLKAIFNNGVTIWKPTVTIGDYTADNRPQ